MVNTIQVPAEPENIAQGKIAIYTEKVRNIDNGIEYIEVHAKDLREDGKGLIGLDIDLTLNSERYDVNQNLIDESEIINRDHLPLFRNKGSVRYNDDGSTAINNIVGAALPRAGTGLALGNQEEPDPQTLFARIPLIVKNNKVASDIAININSYPAAGGAKAREEDLFIINDSNREDVWMLEINPSNTETGNHLFTLQRKGQEITEEKHIVISVKNKNDDPISTNGDSNNGVLNTSAKEGNIYNSN